MRRSALFLTSIALIIAGIQAVAMSPVGAGRAAAAPGGGIRVPLTSFYRDCAFNYQVDNFWSRMPAGQGEAIIRKSGNTVTAEVQFANSRELGVHYDVGLIQAPRPELYSCGPGAPDTVYADMVVDPSGRASVTLQDTIRPGTTGVWVRITRPATHSQLPQEHYASSFIAKV